MNPEQLQAAERMAEVLQAAMTTAENLAFALQQGRPINPRFAANLFAASDRYRDAVAAWKATQSAPHPTAL